MHASCGLHGEGCTGSFARLRQRYHSGGATPYTGYGNSSRVVLDGVGGELRSCRASRTATQGAMMEQFLARSIGDLGIERKLCKVLLLVSAMSTPLGADYLVGDVVVVLFGFP